MPQNLFTSASPVLHIHVVLSTKNHEVLEKARKSNTSPPSEEKKKQTQKTPKIQDSNHQNPTQMWHIWQGILNNYD